MPDIFIKNNVVNEMTFLSGTKHQKFNLNSHIYTFVKQEVDRK